MSSPLLELTKARLKEFYREPGAIFWVFGFPVLLAVGLGIAFRETPPEQPRVAVQDVIWAQEALSSTTTIELVALSQEEALKGLSTGRIDLLVEERDGAVVYRLDPARDGARLAQLVVDRILQQAKGQIAPVATAEHHHSEPGGRYIDFLLPGLIGLNIMGSSMWGLGYTVVMSRKRRLLKRYAATPMRRSHFLLSYLLSRLIFLVAEVGAILLFGVWVFDVAVRGSIVELSLLSVLGAATFGGLSLLIAARVESIEAASGWMNFVMLPMWMLSGSFFSYERFPEVIQPFIRALPLTALNDAVRAVMNEGASLLSCGIELSVLIGWGGIAFLLALRWFKWQ